MSIQPGSRRLPATARILIIRFSSLGDVVKCTGLPRQIKAVYPQARITMLTASEYVELFAESPHLERVLGLERRGGRGAWQALLKSLGERRFELIVDVHHSLRSRLLGLRLSGPHSAYNKRSFQRLLLLHFRINTYRNPQGKEADFLAGLAPYGIGADGQGSELYVAGLAAPLRERMGAELRQIERWRAAGRGVLGIAPVAAWALKRWPLTAFRELMQAYLRKTGGGLLLFGGAGDEDVHRLAEGFGEDAVSLVGRTSIRESAYFASLADVVVANDTGMAHLAEAVGTDVIALFGPTSREWGYYPHRSTSTVLERALFCRPCTRMGEGRCTHPAQQICLKGITPQQVFAQVQSYNRKKTPPC